MMYLRASFSSSWLLLSILFLHIFASFLSFCYIRNIVACTKQPGNLAGWLVSRLASSMTALLLPTKIEDNPSLQRIFSAIYSIRRGRIVLRPLGSFITPPYTLQLYMTNAVCPASLVAPDSTAYTGLFPSLISYILKCNRYIKGRNHPLLLDWMNLVFDQKM